MKIPCPNCGKEYMFAPDASGSNFTCRECMKRFKIEFPSVDGAEGPGGGKKRSALVVVVLVILLVAAAAAGGGFWLWKMRHASPPPPEKAVSKQDKQAEEIIALIAKNEPMLLAEKLRNFDVNWRDREGETMLFYGVRSGDIQLVQQLLGSGFSIDVRNHRGETPLFAAVGSKNLAMFRFLVGRGCDPEATSEKDSLWGCAAAAGSDDILQYMFLAGYRFVDDVPGCDPAIFRALKNQHYECVRILMQHCDIKKLYDRQGNSFGMACIRAGQWEWARKAIDRSNVNHLNREERSALFYACLSDNVVMLDFLLSFEPQTSAATLANSPLAAAISAGSSYAVNKLIPRQRNWNLPDEEGCNFLMLAAQKGDFMIFNAIDNACRFDLLQKNRAGQTVYQIADAGGFADIAAALKARYINAVKPLVAQRLKQLADSKEAPEKVMAKLNDMLREFDGLEEIVNMIEEVSKKVADAAGSKAAPEEPEESH